MESDLINKSYTKEYNSIYEACNAAGEDQRAPGRCRIRALALMDEPTIPLYHLIKTLLLLASIVGMLHLTSRIELLL
jgi:hypothetical protein